MPWFVVLLPLIAGAAVSLQGAVNGTLGKKVGRIESAFISFLTGTLFCGVAIVLFGRGDALAVTQVPLWQTSVAILGPLYVLIMIMVIPVIGVTATAVTVIIAQLTTSMIIDHFGWITGEMIPFDKQRLVALLLLFSSLYFIFKDRKHLPKRRWRRLRHQPLADVQAEDASEKG